MKISLHLDFNLQPQILAKWCVRFRGWGKCLGDRENVEELPSATAYDSSHRCTIHQDNHCTGLVFCTISPISVERNYSKARTNGKRWKREWAREREQQRHHRTTVTLRIINTNLMQLGTTNCPLIEKKHWPLQNWLLQHWLLQKFIQGNAKLVNWIPFFFGKKMWVVIRFTMVLL